MRKTTSKILAMFLAVVMAVGTLPISALAAGVDYDITATTDDYYKLISKRDWELAPGINESEIVLNNESGTQRQVAHVVEVDLNNPYTKVIPGYKEMIPTEGNYGTSSVSAMASYAEENGYGNVVAATNTTLSWYNSSYYVNNPDLVGEPLGYVIMDGELLHTNSQGQSAGASTCIVINYDEREIDGVMTKRPDDMPRVTIRSTADLITGWEEQVIPVSFGFLVKDTNNDGVPENLSSQNHTSGFESRTFVGVKADGTLVVAVSDGRQAPYSTGFNYYEMADMMIKMGCIVAANCDGGGSTEFMSQRPGEDLAINCSLSDGGERPSTNSILVISTAPATGEFARATIETEYDYYTPGSSVTFNALGSDAVGTEVAIPEDVTWALKEEGMGTIENGVFTSNGTTGTVTAQMLYNGNVVGEHSITIAVPDALSFSQPVVTIPYGERAMIPVKATINGGLYEIGLSPEDVTVTIDNDSLGTIDGLHFIGNDTAPTNNLGTVTVTLNANAEVTATVSLKLGDASVVMWDFEDGTLGDWKAIVQRELKQAHRDYTHDLSIATAEDGQVHDGNYSLRLETNGLSSSAVHSQQYAYVRLGLPSQSITLENARSLGFWLYVPEDNIQCWVQGYYRYDTDGDGTYDTLAEVNLMASENVYYNVDESGWHYMTMDLSKQEEVLLGGAWNPDPNNLSADATGDFFIAIIFHKAINNKLWQENGSINGPYTYYIDNITVDYSEVVDDREAPVFGSITLDDNGTKKDMKKRGVVTTTSNILNVDAKVSECTERVEATGESSPLYNYTGIDASSAKAYVDGVEVPCTYTDGKISIANVAVADGYHRVKFEICDNAGNKSVKIRVVEVKSGVDASTIQFVPADATLDRLLGGSVYWMNMNATDIETIQSVTTVIDLNNVNHWELDHMELAYGFSSEYTINEETNTATITITRTGTNTQTGAATLAKLPVRIVSFDTDMQIPGYTAETFWTTYNLWPHDLKLDVDKGVITYVDGYASAVQPTFSNDEFQVDTEIYTDSQSMDVNYRAEKGTAHVHTPVALEDKAATCTEGYTGRTYCEVCDSVVDWGTTLPALGEHKYEVVDGKLTCTYGGEVFDGVYSDGKTYIDGVVAEGWTADNTSYYKDGVKLTGSHFFDNAMYTFDEKGVYLPDYKYDGFFNIDGTVMYFVNNEYLTGAQTLGNDAYYFDDKGLGIEGEFVLCGETCLFDNGRYVSCSTADLLDAGWCGKKVEYVVYTDGLLKLGGSGNTYQYKNHGNRPFIDCLEQITKIQIGKDITVLDLNICSYLLATEVVFEEGSVLKNISTGAFHSMPRLKSINIPKGVTSIGAIAFKNSTGLRRINIPATVKNINSTAFKGCNSALVFYVASGSYAESVAQSNSWNYTNESFIRNGFIEEDGELYYYENDVKWTRRGVFQVGNDFYYAKNGGGLLRNQSTWASITNDLLPKKIYDFDENGKMNVKNGFIEEDGELYYYVNEVKWTRRGAFQVGDDFYYAKSDGSLLRNQSTWATITNDLIPKKIYDFDENGKMNVKNGFIEEDGELYYYVNEVKWTRRGVFQVGNDFYYAKNGGGLLRNQSTWASITNDLIPKKIYDFDENGKMNVKNGFIEEDSELYYYVNEVKWTRRGVFQVGDDFYYAKNGGGLIRSQCIWATVTNDLVPFAKYNFDENGKMIFE